MITSNFSEDHRDKIISAAFLKTFRQSLKNNNPLPHLLEKAEENSGFCKRQTLQYTHIVLNFGRPVEETEKRILLFNIEKIGKVQIFFVILLSFSE